MIKLTDKVYVAAHAIKSIEKSEYHDYITVRLFDGESHTIYADYGKGIYETLDRLVAEVRADSGIEP
jgi:hypothetical protein